MASLETRQEAQQGSPSTTSSPSTSCPTCTDHGPLLTSDCDSICNCDQDKVVIDNSNLMMERIASLYADRLLSDLILVVGKHKFTAHRLILCTSSDVFQVMLMNPNWTESQGNEINLNEDPECEPFFADFLKYLYTGRIAISVINVLPILILSDKYNVQDLIKLCMDYMSSHIVKAATNNQLVSWLQYCQQCSHVTLAFSCINFIAWNFELVANQDADFANLDMQTMRSLLSRDDLVVRDELTLFTCVSRWLFFQEKRAKDEINDQTMTSTASPASKDRNSERRRSSPLPLVTDKGSLDAAFESLVTEIMTLIRFPMMSPLELANLLIDPLVSRFKGFLVDQMAGAMIYHNLHAPPSCVRSSSTSPASSSLARNLSASTGRFLEVPTLNNQLQVELNPRKKQKMRCENEDKLLIPRLYTNEKWSASLITDNYSSVPIYGTRTLMFQTPSSLFHDDKNYPRRCSSPSTYPSSASPNPYNQTPTLSASSSPMSASSTVSNSNLNSNNNSMNEWAIDLYPKGLWFKSFQLIVWHGTLECPEVVIKTVRLSVTSIRARNEKVKIGILIYGRQEGIDFIKQITTKIHTFTSHENMININDLIPYESLNIPLSDQLRYTPRSLQVTMSNKSGFLIGPANDTFKIHVVITPLTNY